VPVANFEIKALLDLETMTTHMAAHCNVNDIAVVKITLGRPAAIDVFADISETGTLMLVDAISGASIAGGVAIAVNAKSDTNGDEQFVLTREMLANGLCRDLSLSSTDREEFMRRANEAAFLLRAAGVSVTIEPPPMVDDSMDPGL
jgi:bifunctional enzyme CysN/CysC